MSRYRSKPFQSTTSHTVLIETAVRDFLLHHERKGDSQSYLRELHSYLMGGAGKYGTKRAWKPLVPWCALNEIRNACDLDKASIGAFLDHVRSIATRSDYGKVCVILKRLLAFWVTEDYVPALPMQIPAPKRFKAEIKVFTVAEMQRLHDVVRKENVRDWAIFMLLLDTGMRTSELCNLRVEDIRFDRQEVIIRPAIAKNRTYRIVPLHSSLRALQRYYAVRGPDMSICDKFLLAFYSTPVVLGGTINRKRRNLPTLSFCTSGLTRNGVFQLVQKWGRLASITEARCSPHTFRHFFATQYLRSGGDVVSLQRILGHSRLDVTERYLRFAGTDVAAQHRKFTPGALFMSGPM